MAGSAAVVNAGGGGITDAPATVVFAPDSFKSTAGAADVAGALAAGWRAERPQDSLIQLPLADGGEGTLDCLKRAVPGSSATS